MKNSTNLNWHPKLIDPTGKRNCKPRICGKTMVMDKGLGLHAFNDLLQTSAEYIDMIKIGFGTSPLYSQKILQQKINLAKEYSIEIFPGGTFLEVAIAQNCTDAFLAMINRLGFTGIEVSDGTIEMSRYQRNELIRRGIQCNLTVFTEYGKKCWGSSIEIEALIETIHHDVESGTALITIEGRESGVGVGIYDSNGNCKEDELQEVLSRIRNLNIILWEAPLKKQQVQLIKTLGTDVNIGNVAPHDILSLEALRRGLRSDTFVTVQELSIN